MGYFYHSRVRRAGNFRNFEIKPFTVGFLIKPVFSPSLGWIKSEKFAEKLKLFNNFACSEASRPYRLRYGGVSKCAGGAEIKNVKSFHRRVEHQRSRIQTSEFNRFPRCDMCEEKDENLTYSKVSISTYYFELYISWHRFRRIRILRFVVMTFSRSKVRFDEISFAKISYNHVDVVSNGKAAMRNIRRVGYKFFIRCLTLT